METRDIRKKISESVSAKWFNSIILTINYPNINFSQKFKGIIDIHKFLSQQIVGWNKYLNLPNEFKPSLEHFGKLKLRLENFIDANHNSDERNLNNLWQQEENQLRKFNINRPYFTFDSPYTKFLYELKNSFPEAYYGAYYFIIGNHRLNNSDDFTGTLLAYEFKFKDFTELTNRRNKEKTSFTNLRNNLNKQISESETQLNDHLKELNVTYQDNIKKINQFKKDKESLFNKWFDDSKGKFTTFHTDSNNKIKDLEKTYGELLKLKKPAEYWRARATKLNKEGWKAITWMVGLIVFAGIALYSLLWLTPEGVLLNFIEDPIQSVKWSVIYITFISLLAYGIRILHKTAFSSFHLARDSEEREQLTYVYLSLINESGVDEKDRILILQSLFSRADTGLLKDDSGPTMPNNLTNKIIEGP